MSGSRVVLEPVEPDGRSSVQVVRNARGTVQLAVKVYAGDSAADVDEARRRAVTIFRSLEDEFRQPE